MRGVWTSAASSSRADLHRAALLVSPDGAFLSHESAAELWGGVVPASDTMHLGIATDRRKRVGGISVHRYTTTPEVLQHKGFPVTSRAQTFIDLAARLTLIDLVVLGDSWARRDPMVAAALVQAADRAAGRGARRARAAARLVRPGVRSPRETRTRLLLVLAGFPEPTVSHEICGDDGRVIYELDLAYVEWRLGFEYDGRHHIERAQQWGKDLLRREDVESLGWRVVVLIGRDHYRPAQTLGRIRRAAHSVGMPVPPLSHEWQLHFPDGTLGR